MARFGALATLVAGLLITGVASGLRGAALDVAVLYAATILMSGGIAIMQPALPLLVRQWLPQRESFGTAVYSNGLWWRRPSPSCSRSRSCCRSSTTPGA